MTTVLHTQNIFNGGELSPLIRGRADLQRYKSGAQTMLNLVPMPQGGVTRRPGMLFLGEAKNTTSRLIKFIFSTTQGRMLEFGNYTMRVWMPDGTLVADPSNTAQPLVVVTPFAAADLSALHFAQDGDVIYFAHPSYAPCKLSRYADTSWTFTTLTFLPDVVPPTGLSASIIGSTESTTTTTKKYVVTAVSETTGQESVASDVLSVTAASLPTAYYIQVSWTAATGASEYRVYKYKGGVYGFIGRSTSTSFEDQNITADTEDTPPTYNQYFSSAGNYPSLVFFHQQRLGYAASNNDPYTVWMSRSYLLESFSESLPPKDDDCIKARFRSSQANRFVWLVPDRTALCIGTIGGNLTVEPSSGNVLTPGTTSFVVAPQESNGSEPLSPLSVGGATIFAQRGFSAVRDFAYNYLADKYKSDDLTLLSRHILQDVEIVAWDYQQEPHSIIWCALSDGTMASCTLMKEQEVVAWARHETDGEILSVATMPGTPDDQVWMLVRRTVHGTAKVFVEKLAPFFDDDDPSGANFLDSALTYSGTAATSFSGFGHLSGETVTAFADGGVVTGVTVSNGGGFTLGTAASVVTAGLPYTSTLIPMRPEVDTQAGSSMLHNRKLLDIRARVYRTMPFAVGVVGSDKTWTITDRDIVGGEFQTAPFFASSVQDLYLGLVGSWSADAIPVITIDTPTPFTLLAMMVTLEITPYPGKI